MRWRKCSKRFALPRALLSSSLLLVWLGVVFVVGAVLYAIGTWILRRERAATTADQVVTIVQSVSEETQAGNEAKGAELKLDQIERLAVVGLPWCVEQLEREYLVDDDEMIRMAAENALLVIRARR